MFDTKKVRTLPPKPQNPKQPIIQIHRNRKIELDKKAKQKLTGAWDEIELVLLRIQRELAVESEDPTEAGFFVKALAKIKDEFQNIAIEGETMKKKEQEQK